MPKWSHYIEKYLRKVCQDDKLPKHQQKAIEVEASSYALIGDQLFKRGRYNNLRLCVYETNYFSVLTHALRELGVDISQEIPLLV